MGCRSPVEPALVGLYLWQELLRPDVGITYVVSFLLLPSFFSETGNLAGLQLA